MEFTHSFFFLRLQCDISKDHVVVGGSKNFNTANMHISSRVCGHSEQIGPEQAIFCEVTTVRLVSHGNHHNQVILTVRNSDENDINIATLICPL